MTAAVLLQALRAAWVALRTPLGQIVAVCLIFGSLALWHGEERYRDGVQAERGRWEALQAAAQARAAGIVQRQAVASATVGATVTERQAQVRTVTQTLIKEVPIYVTAEADRRCDVPAGFVRLHDAAAAGLPAAPDPAGRPADAASGVALSAVGETVVANYGACRTAIEQLTGWQAWWAAVSAPTL